MTILTRRPARDPIGSASGPSPAVKTNPRDRWPDWTDADRWEPAPDAPPRDVDTTDHSRPFEPSAEDRADQFGYALVMSGERPAPPKGWPHDVAVSFYMGLIAGEKRRDADLAELNAWLDTFTPTDEDWDRMYADRSPLSHNEMIEARGHHEG